MRLRVSKLMLIGLCATAMTLGCEPEDPEGGGEGGAGGVVGAGGEGGAGAAGGQGGAGEGGAGGAGAAGGEGGAGAAGGEGGAGAAGGEGGAGAAGGEGGAGAAGGEGGAGAAGGQGGGGAGGAGGDCEDVPSVSPDDPMYERYEGIGFDNACRTDEDCFRGGCSQEVCSASPEVASTCEAVPIPDGSCGCVQGECIWHVEECGPCTDTDDDGICNDDDSDCNADGTPLMCRRAAPECRAGTVPEIREGCYTDRCVTWDQCGGEPPCPDADGDRICNDDDRVCGPNEVACDAEPPACRGGTVPEAQDGCWTGRCVTWEQCGEPACPDADGDGLCDDADRVCGDNEVLCDGLPPECRRGTVPEAEGGCWTGRCVTWEQCGAGEPEPQMCGGIAGIRCRDANQVCVDDPRDNCNPERGADCSGICVDEERLCSPVRAGEFGECEAIIGYAMNARGVCAAVSGCGCDVNCAGRVFPSQRACEAQCAGPMCEADADEDAICDADDTVCNADGTPLQCRRVAPDCPRGTVPEVRETCYTDRCVTWEECGEPACPDADGDGVCDAEDGDCNADGTPLRCRRAPPVCRERGTVPEIRDGCYTGDCVTWEECGGGGPVEACAPIEPGEFGFCRAIIGWGIQAETGACGIISGCGCDERCEGRVFENERECQAACEEAEPEPQMCGGFAGLRCREAGQACVDDPRDNCAPPRGADCSGVCIDEERVCTPVRQGEFGDCEAIIGWAQGGRGCVQVSGCGCDINCAGRVYADQRTCEAACAARE